MTERLTTPSDPREAAGSDTLEMLNTSDLGSGRPPWDRNYVDLPQADRIGIACSGGGIRSASYCLGALQELRHSGVLEKTRYLSCVSGGGYIAIAHAILIDQTLRGSVDDAPTTTEALFGGSPAWSPGSPEEQHLRNHLDYIAPGLSGKLWGVVNALYGAVKHFLPFAAVLFVASYLLGVVYFRWVGPRLRRDVPSFDYESLWPFVWLVVGLLVVAGALLLARQWVSRTEEPNELALSTLQGWVVAVVWVSMSCATLLVLFPVALVWVAGGGPFDVPTIGLTWAFAGAALAAAKAAASLARRGIFKRVVLISAPLLTPCVILIPLLALTYWCAQSVFPTVSLRWADRVPWLKEVATRPQSWLLVASAVVLVVMRYLDDVMPVPHLYYRERLATAFVGRRRLSPDRESVRYEQPPWSIPIQLSRLSRGPKSATLPNLVICAAANLSGDVPLGRSATGFTFEKDVCGSPLTGYVSTAFLEELAVGDTLTMPALMAISGAAVAPSMGKMTRPSLRFVMALFNLRRGVWLPNPFSIRPRMSAREARQLREVRHSHEPPSERN